MHQPSLKKCRFSLVPQAILHFLLSQMPQHAPTQGENVENVPHSYANAIAIPAGATGPASCTQRPGRRLSAKVGNSSTQAISSYCMQLLLLGPRHWSSRRARLSQAHYGPLVGPKERCQFYIDQSVRVTADHALEASESTIAWQGGRLRGNYL